MMDDDLTFTTCSNCLRPHAGSKLYCERCRYDIGTQINAQARERRGIVSDNNHMKAVSDLAKKLAQEAKRRRDGKLA